MNKNGNRIPFDFNIQDIEFKTIGINCKGCSNNCELVKIYKDGKIIDVMGGRCERGNRVEVV